MYLLLGGLLLLVAMVGAVALTLEPKKPNQDSQAQQYRSISSSVSLSRETSQKKKRVVRTMRKAEKKTD